MISSPEDQYTCSEAECLDCNKKWIACHPLNASNLQCPKCFKFNTERYQIEEATRLNKNIIPKKLIN
jgi:hypothetical protein